MELPSPVRSPPKGGDNPKLTITCSNIPESLLDPSAAKKHFSKFGKVQRILLSIKKQTCNVDYEEPSSVERALLNAGAYDGFMFDVTRAKPRVRRKSKRENDPDWVPDSDVEEELSAMRGGPSYITRQSRMDVTAPQAITPKSLGRTIKQSPIRKKLPIREKPVSITPKSGIDSPVLVSMTQTTLSTSEAAAELNQLRHKVSLTPDEQWRILDARDRIVRAWGGAGARARVGGATLGTCPDMCPEKERLHRQAEHQVMSLETAPDSDYRLEPRRAVKQYSRSSADQEMPMCYELRPARVLERTCAYLLSEVADTARPVTLADWFHFLWDRFRGIRKDITQQALCCAESIRLVEMCARFHAHCAARLADLEHTQFDQKLNTDNLTKCLQTLKHMYADVGPAQKPREAEFRGYIALLNLGDANFWWEVKSLPQDIQKSEEIAFAVKVFNALDNNNYVRFFRLVKENATYLQACILLRYFNDVRARGLARIVKAFAPRGASRYPAEELMNVLAFETIDSMKSFVTHYGQRFGKTDETELTVILDRKQFIEDSDPYPVARALHLIESKRHCKVGAVIAGGQVPIVDFERNIPYSSFNADGTLKEEALTAQDQGYNTTNDSNKNLQGLRDEIRRLGQGGKTYTVMDEAAETQPNVFVKTEMKSLSAGKVNTAIPRANVSNDSSKLSFSFQPAIPVAPVEIIQASPVKSPGKELFTFSKPQDNKDGLFSIPNETAKDLFGKSKNENSNVFNDKTNAESKPVQNTLQKSIFGQSMNKNNLDSQKIFENNSGTNIFADKVDIKLSNQNVFGSNNIFTNSEDNPFTKPDTVAHSEKGSIFGSLQSNANEIKTPSSVFGSFKKHKDALRNDDLTGNSKSIFAPNENNNAISPGSFFKGAIKTENQVDKPYSIFPSKNNAQSQNMFNSNNASKNGEVYEFKDNDLQNQLDAQNERMKEEENKRIEELKRMEEIRREEARTQELKRVEEEKRQEEVKRKQQELLARMEEERRKEELRKKEEIRKLLEEEEKKRIEEARIAEMKRKAEEDRLFKLRVDKDSTELTEELINEVKEECVKDLMTEELQKLNDLMTYASETTEEILIQLCSEICNVEMLAEKIWTRKLMKKWFIVWRRQFVRNVKRRKLLEDTPVWLPGRTPIQEASCLKRSVENDTLKHMNAFHRGYKFPGVLPQAPNPELLNLMEIVKSPLIKRMKEINYRYDKGLFWKATLVSPGPRLLCRKVNVENWLRNSFSDKKEHEVSSSLIYVGKDTWNQLIDFGISISLRTTGKDSCSEAMEGTNALLYYTTENESNLIETVQETLRSKYPYQLLPIAIITPVEKNECLEQFLIDCVNNKSISAYKIFIVDSKYVYDSLEITTKSALKWLARKCPEVPPLEIDNVKSICERYLGNEIWLRLRKVGDSRIDTVMKDLKKLVNCYNVAVDKLTEVITNEDLFNYPLFPIEFKDYLNNASLYPKPYEYIPSSARSSENTSMIKQMMRQLKLPDPVGYYQPATANNMQEQIHSYCNQIGWFQCPEKSTLEVTMLDLSEILRMPHEHFKAYFENYDLSSFLNLIVYEKIHSLRDFDNRFAIYKTAAIEDFRNALWLYEVDFVCKLKHKAIEYEDEVDEFIDAKRRKIALDSLEYLILDNNDSTLVDESIREVDANILKYTDCKDEVEKLEAQIEEERKKSMNLENVLRSALQDV